MRLGVLLSLAILLSGVAPRVGSESCGRSGKTIKFIGLSDDAAILISVRGWDEGGQAISDFVERSSGGGGMASITVPATFRGLAVVEEKSRDGSRCFRRFRHIVRSAEGDSSASMTGATVSVEATSVRAREHTPRTPIEVTLTGYGGRFRGVPDASGLATFLRVPRGVYSVVADWGNAIARGEVVITEPSSKFQLELIETDRSWLPEELQDMYLEYQPIVRSAVGRDRVESLPGSNSILLPREGGILLGSSRGNRVAPDVVAMVGPVIPGEAERSLDNADQDLPVAFERFRGLPSQFHWRLFVNSQLVARGENLDERLPQAPSGDHEICCVVKNEKSWMVLRWEPARGWRLIESEDVSTAVFRLQDWPGYEPARAVVFVGGCVVVDEAIALKLMAPEEYDEYVAAIPLEVADIVHIVTSTGRVLAASAGDEEMSERADTESSQPRGTLFRPVTD